MWFSRLPIADANRFAPSSYPSAKLSRRHGFGNSPVKRLSFTPNTDAFVAAAAEASRVATARPSPARRLEFSNAHFNNSLAEFTTRSSDGPTTTSTVIEADSSSLRGHESSFSSAARPQNNATHAMPAAFLPQDDFWANRDQFWKDRPAVQRLFQAYVQNHSS